MSSLQHVSAVYGPVRSWRFGQSLGIDLLGGVPTCSYNCLYCQLGNIDRVTCDRAVFVPTAQIAGELAAQDWQGVEVVTFSGSGEPTLALNLGEVIHCVQSYTSLPMVVLTNGTLLGDLTVQQNLANAHVISVKLDAVSSDRWHTINRPAPGLHLESVLEGILALREKFMGKLAIQTMVMEPWTLSEEQRYIAILKAIQTDEVQINTPLRPRPVRHHLEARGNQSASTDRLSRSSRHVSTATLQAMVDRLQTDLDMPIHYRGEQALTN
jgi:wyosine [tRNA(Phe)-imidazoG37] synthetase (radical SAM superfamily)